MSNVCLCEMSNTLLRMLELVFFADGGCSRRSVWDKHPSGEPGDRAVTAR